MAALGACLDDPDWETRVEVVLALSQLAARTPEAWAALARALGDTHPRVQARAAQAFGAWGPQAGETIDVLELVGGASRAEHPFVRRYALEALVSIPSPPDLGQALSKAGRRQEPRARSTCSARGRRGEDPPSAPFEYDYECGLAGGMKLIARSARAVIVSDGLTPGFAETAEPSIT